jgi:hypothetical protein
MSPLQGFDESFPYQFCGAVFVCVFDADMITAIRSACGAGPLGNPWQECVFVGPVFYKGEIRRGGSLGNKMTRFSSVWEETSRLGSDTPGADQNVDGIDGPSAQSAIPQ